MKKNHKKILASALIAGAAISGGVAVMSGQSASAMTDTVERSLDSSETRERPELSEEKKAEIKEKLSNMTEEEKQAWPEEHKGRRPERGTGDESGRPGKPANLTDKEWEAKKAEIKEKLSSMTEEEKQAWLEEHKGRRSERASETTEE